MAYELTAAHGIAVKLGDGSSPETFTEIQGVHNGPNGPGVVQNIIEARHHGSETTVRKQSSGSISPMSFSIYYDSANPQHAALHAAGLAGTSANFQVVGTDTGAEKVAFEAFIDFVLKGEVDGFNVADVTLNLVDAYTRT